MSNPSAPPFKVDEYNPAQRVVSYDDLGRALPVDPETAVHLLREILEEIRGLRAFLAEAIG